MSDMSPRHTSHKGWNEGVNEQTSKKLRFLRRFSPFLHRDERETRETREWLVMKRKGPVGMRKMRGEDVSPVVSVPPSFARTFSVRERRLGTRQNQKHIYASITKPLVLLSPPSCPYTHSCYPDVLRVHPLYQCTTLILSLELLERKVSL